MLVCEVLLHPPVLYLLQAISGGLAPLLSFSQPFLSLVLSFIRELFSVGRDMFVKERP